MEANQYIATTNVRHEEVPEDALISFGGTWGPVMLEVETLFAVYHTTYNFTANSRLWKDGEIKHASVDFSTFYVRP